MSKRAPAPAGAPQQRTQPIPLARFIPGVLPAAPGLVAGLNRSALG